MTPTVYKYDSTADYATEAAEAIESMIQTKLDEEKGIFKLALSGGTSPIPVLKKLSASKAIDWSNVEIYQVDERCVPTSSPDSNWGMIERELLSKIPDIRAAYSFDTSKKPEDAAKEYEKVFQDAELPLFDLVLLGLGDDGHTASLFPQTKALHEMQKFALSILSPKGIKDRLTLTFKAILSSNRLLFLVRGKDKEPILDKMLAKEGAVDFIPARKCLDHPHVEIFFDPSAE